MAMFADAMSNFELHMRNINTKMGFYTNIIKLKTYIKCNDY